MEKLLHLSKDELIAYIYFQKNQVSLLKADKDLSKLISENVSEIAAKLLSLGLIRYSGPELIVLVNDL